VIILKKPYLCVFKAYQNFIIQLQTRNLAYECAALHNRQLF